MKIKMESNEGSIIVIENKIKVIVAEELLNSANPESENEKTKLNDLIMRATI